MSQFQRRFSGARRTHLLEPAKCQFWYNEKTEQNHRLKLGAMGRFRHRANWSFHSDGSKFETVFAAGTGTDAARTDDCVHGISKRKRLTNCDSGDEWNLRTGVLASSSLFVSRFETGGAHRTPREAAAQRPGFSVPFPPMWISTPDSHISDLRKCKCPYATDGIWALFGRFRGRSFYPNPTHKTRETGLD